MRLNESICHEDGSGLRASDSGKTMKAYLITEDADPMPWEDWSYPCEIVLGEQHQAERRIGELEKLRPKSLFRLYKDIELLDLRQQN